MSDSRELRISELKRLLTAAQESVEALSELRVIMRSIARENTEHLWLMQAIDNRRVMMLGKIEQFTQGIEQARDNAQPEIGALFIDGRKI